MTILTDYKNINDLREGGKILAFILDEVSKKAVPGVKTVFLDELAEKMIKNTGGRPSFKNYKTSGDKIPYPASLCVSTNDEVVHGIPGERILEEGDIVSLDLGMEYNGFYTDMAVTVPVGRVSREAKKLIAVTKNSLDFGIKEVGRGTSVNSIGKVIQFYIEQQGFNVVRNLVGHGLGRKAHEAPEIPNFYLPRNKRIFEEGEVLAIEPMVTFGHFDVYLDDDLWTWKTADGSLSAHFEHTIIVTETGAEIITKK